MHPKYVLELGNWASKLPKKVAQRSNRATGQTSCANGMPIAYFDLVKYARIM